MKYSKITHLLIASRRLQPLTLREESENDKLSAELGAARLRLDTLEAQRQAASLRAGGRPSSYALAMSAAAYGSDPAMDSLELGMKKF